MADVVNSESSKKLSTLLDSWSSAVAGTGHPQPPLFDGPDVTIRRFVEHTDDVEPGVCFVARVRTGTDGHPYIRQAVAGGASLILAQRSRQEVGLKPGEVAYLQVEDTALALAWLAAAWYDFPSRQLVMVGVTGTDGKTTTVNLIHRVLAEAGLQTGMLSTIRAAVGDEREPLALHVTTPEAPVVQRYLRRMVEAGLTHCVLEVTSHALAQHRVAAVDFDVAVLTNITHEHLDYHGDFESYFAAKKSLFTGLVNRSWRGTSQNKYKSMVVKTAVLNADDDSYAILTAIPFGRKLSYGLTGPADVTAQDVSYGANATRFRLDIGRWDLAADGSNDSLESVLISSSLVGPFNVHNMLAAASAGLALGLRVTDIKRGLVSISVLDGRMEPIQQGQPFQVLVDFAHTPNALKQAIAAARGLTSGRIVAVFGSAGKRDLAKRRLMAEVSARDADLTVLTAEDPRTESLDDILGAMADGCRAQGGIEGETFWRVPDRGQAIYLALTLARPEDLVLICGKGHEQSMCFGDIEYPWDDRLAAKTALDAFLAGRPMPDLGLPTYRA